MNLSALVEKAFQELVESAKMEEKLLLILILLLFVIKIFMAFSTEYKIFA